jgi:WYL_2, Sm-like SH3 beta-barrel fold
VTTSAWDKETLKSLAKTNIIRVTFTKVSGETRVMRCTLREEYLPAQEDLENHTTKKNTNALAVWDIDNSGWRSFRVDSVTKVEVLND